MMSACACDGDGDGGGVCVSGGLLNACDAVMKTDNKRAIRKAKVT